MTVENRLPQVLLELAPRLGLEELTLSPEGTLNLLIDHSWTVELQCEEERDQLYIQSPLPVPPLDEKNLPLLLELFAAPLEDSTMGGMFFALDRDVSEVLLMRVLKLSKIDIEELENEIFAFLTVLKKRAESFNENHMTPGTDDAALFSGVSV